MGYMEISTNPPTSIEICIHYLVHDNDLIFNTAYQKRGSEMKSYVTLVIRYTWFVFDFSRLSSEFKSPYNSFYMYVSSDCNNF